MTDLSNITAAQLRRAASIRERIEDLHKELDTLLSGKGRSAGASASSGSPAKKKRRKKRSMSPEARERIAAAQRKRWALHNKAKKKAAKAAK